MDSIEPLIPRHQISNNEINVRGSRRLLFIFLLGATVGFVFSSIFIWGTNLSLYEDDLSMDEEYNDDEFGQDFPFNEHSRIMCLIVMSPEDKKISAEFVETTWGRHCNQLLITSPVDMQKNHTLLMPYEKENNNLWNNTLIALMNLYALRRHEFEWIFKTNVDSFAIIENLHYMLKPYSPLDSIYFGVRFNPNKPKGKKSSSYVLSREALFQFHDEILMQNTKCRLKIAITEDEDLEFERCLRLAQVKAMDSRDDQNKHRFMAYLSTMPPIYYDNKVLMNHTNYVENYLSYSEYPVCFHLVPFEEMYQMQYMLYQLRPYGVLKEHQIIYEKSNTATIQTTNYSNLTEETISIKDKTLKSYL